MDPVCFRIAGFPIHWFGVMMALGFVAGLVAWMAVGRREGRDLAFCSDLLFWTMVSGVLGARLAYVISDWQYFMENPGLLIRLDKGGLIYYGGVMAAIVAVYVFARIRRESPARVFDLVAVALPLAHAFGRIGCFFNGCCHGRLYDGPLAVHFPKDSLPYIQHLRQKLITWDDSYSRYVHPVQLYEAAANLAVFAVLTWIYLHRKRDGTTTGAYLLLYPVTRFSLEFFRGDERMAIGNLNMAQVISVGLFVAGLVVLFRARAAGHSAVAEPDPATRP